jgi:hypothetical protein
MIGELAETHVPVIDDIPKITVEQQQSQILPNTSLEHAV